MTIFLVTFNRALFSEAVFSPFQVEKLGHPWNLYLAHDWRIRSYHLWRTPASYADGYLSIFDDLAEWCPTYSYSYVDFL
jgi:hypothetical protein